MEQTNPPQTTGLEDQLRNMILGNVTIAKGQTSNEYHSNQRGRGRGRGRGVFSRGSDRSRNDLQEQGPGWRPRGHHDMAPHRGRGRVYPPNQRIHQHHHSPQAQHSFSQAQDGSSHSPTNQQDLRSPRQPYNQPSLANGPPSILQRQHHHHHAPSAQGVPGSPSSQPSRPYGSFQSRPYPNHPREDPVAQADHLESIAIQEVPKVEMSIAELDEKEAFRRHLEDILRTAFAHGYTGDMATFSLVGFGSLASGFAMPGSDMDLAVVPQWKDQTHKEDFNIDRKIPRLLEQAILDAKMGGRLLTRTRVPILKVCQSPTDELYTALVEERQKWDNLPGEEQYPSEAPQEHPSQSKPLAESDIGRSPEPTQNADNPNFGEEFPMLGASRPAKINRESKPAPEASSIQSQASIDKELPKTGEVSEVKDNKEQQSRSEKPWKREKILGPLDFPKTGCGIQCDINFGNSLGIHNTHMLRCYSLTDPRVRPIVLFIKSWAKRRKINSSYSGTLSSYGWVLMVLHYLVNIAQPPVCPNLQRSAPQPTDLAALEQFVKETTVNGYNVRFWRNEQEIMQAAQAGRLSQNRQSVGELLRGFFQYFAGISSGYGYGHRPPQFYWTNEVLSLRTPGGIVSKQSKGWVSATTKITAEKKVTNRYLFAIEDPFEIDHNVARTVTHRGIVAIRDEFRRAWRILRAVGQGQEPEGGIFDEVIEAPSTPVAKEENKEVPQTDETVALDLSGIALRPNGQSSVV